jgi:hypothetical protein
LIIYGCGCERQQWRYMDNFFFLRGKNVLRKTALRQYPAISEPSANRFEVISIKTIICYVARPLPLSFFRNHEFRTRLVFFIFL